MPQLLQPSFAEYLGTFVYKIYNQVTYNTLYFGAYNNQNDSAEKDNLVLIGQSIADFFAPSLKANLVTEHRYEGIYISMVRGLSILPSSQWVTAQSGPGTVVGSPCPAGVCVNIHYKAPYKGKTFRRYIAFPGLTDADINDSGKVTLAKRNQLLPIADKLLLPIAVNTPDPGHAFSLFVLGMKRKTSPLTGTTDYAYPTTSSVSEDTTYRRSRRLRSDPGNLPI